MATSRAAGAGLGLAVLGVAAAAGLLLAGSAPKSAAAADLPSPAAWQGKSPADRKPGFYDSAALRDAAVALIGAQRYKMLQGWTVSAPIVTDGAALLSWSCKPHDCADNNQATLIDGGKVMICLTERGAANWYLPDRKGPIAVPGGGGGPGQGCNLESVQDARKQISALR